MGEKIIPLHLMPCGHKARVSELRTEGNMRRRMLDLGLIKGTVVEAIGRSPSGDPTAYGFRGAVIALRSEEASTVMVEIL